MHVAAEKHEDVTEQMVLFAAQKKLKRFWEKNDMKKLLCLILTIGFSLGLTGCGGNGAEEATEVYEDATEGVVTKSFIGTVVEETDTYMYVEPDKDEEERKLSDKIAVFYTAIHADYFYGTGRRVVVYYESDAINEKNEILSDDISTEGFRDFEMDIKENGSTRFERVLIADEADEAVTFGQFGDLNVVTYGVDVTINADGREVTLKEALEKGYVTPQAITVRANRDVKLGQAELVEYRDGGSREYVYDNYKIIKYHTEGGKRDLYIGSLNMKYSE